MSRKYRDGLEKVPANYQPLTPIHLLSRSALVYPERIAIVHGDRRITYKDFYANARRLASALTNYGVNPEDTVSIMAANIPAFLDAHFGVPMTGAVLNSLNTRLDAKALAFILDHAETDILLTDTAYSKVIKEALSISSRSPLIIDIDDPLSNGGELLGKLGYKEFLAGGDPEFVWEHPIDEWQAIALNYTSGTTGDPKGVVYSHRGAYLNSLGNQLSWVLGDHPVYLWTLPMFHCNGWCFPWTITAASGTHVCLREVEVKAISAAMINESVTHFCGAPIVLNMILNAEESILAKLPRGIKAYTAGAPPPSAIIKGMEVLGFDITHSYGLTEVYGPCVVSQWKSEWNGRPDNERAALKARQGVRYITQEALDVLNPETMQPVPSDGKTIGEIMFQGNTTMEGYLKNPTTTKAAFADGWFHSGDLAVKHPDGYLEIRDRAKDIIISGGENISSVEVEGALYQNPVVLEAAVVAKPDEKWGESPCAFVTLKPDKSATEKEIIDHCRDQLASFKAPKSVIFGSLPKTSTGKIQKFILRESIRNLEADT
jgi:fatty-acyl-CoA synthase